MNERPLLLVGRLRRGHWVALDVVMAVALCSLLVGGALVTGRPMSVPYLLGMYAPLAARRLWPVPVLVAVCAVAASSVAMGVVPTEPFPVGDIPDAIRSLAWPQPMAVTIALYTVATSVRRGPAVLYLLGAGTALSVAALLARPAEEAAGAVVICWLLFVTQWVTGLVVRERRLFMTRLAVRTARQAVLEERLRIARDLHDSVAHSMSVITVQATVAGHLAEERPEEARSALAQIEQTGRAAQAEMRRMLGLLRHDETDADAGAPRDAPGLAALPDLAADAAAAGVEVALEVDPGLRLDNGAGLTVYRLVQEGLTNVAKHAAPTRCLVAVTSAADGIRVRIADEGPPPGQRRAEPTSAGGHGIAGMRERVGLYGGTLTAGPTPAGFEVLARLPLEGR
ncbi:sensor histidine kinase [Spongiactinospora rosea]|uniref:histidine kinase n=1 Tax=Spongiactinospora rosea TaxID=2248750 RepID=A0A366LNR3_9ACTN|nr:sensor histidine kinase [Spongiactinospora rosea]RBQ15556.1 sensor histidine kinase [Spongiactinospora rosea]